jgi:hypothetical protein
MEPSNTWSLNDTAEDHLGVEQPIMADASDPSILTRKTDPFRPVRVDAIMAKLKIGADLSPTEHARLEEVLRSFANCFALSMSEVIAVDGAEHKLNIPNCADAKFRTNPRQCPLSTPQRVYLNNVIDKMLKADIIAPIDHRDVKCCSATTLAKKVHDSRGLTLEQLQHCVNDECIANRFPAAFNNLPPREPLPSKPDGTEQPKWRICQEFNDLNKVTEVPPYGGQFALLIFPGIIT